MRYVIYLIAVVITLISLNVSAIPNDHMVANSIKRGGRPTIQDLNDLKRQGYKTIINLENNQSAISKERKYAEQLGFNYVLSEMSTYVTPNDNEIRRVLAVLNDPSQQPVFIHCLHGQDRTGLVVGLHRVLNENWKPEDSYKEMLDLGFHPRYTQLKNYFFDVTKGN